MKSVLKGNFETRENVEIKTEKPEDLEDRFERTALKRLGGSMAFVKKTQVMWDDKEGK